MTFKFEMGTVLLSELDENGFPVAQYDAHGEEPRVEPYELHHTFGFASRPRDPTDGVGCNVLVATEGDKNHAWLGYDPRFIETFPKLKKGGSMQYSAPGSFQVLDGDNGTSTLYVTVPGQNKAHAFTMGLDGNGEPYVGIVHADGMAVYMLDNSLVAKNASGDAYVQLSNAGIVLNGNVRHNGAMVMGTTAAVSLVLGPPLVALLQTLAGIIDAKTPVNTAASSAVAAAIATLQTLLVKGS